MASPYEALAEPGLDLVFDVHAEAVDYARTSQDSHADFQTLTGVFNPVHQEEDAEGRPVTVNQPVLDLRRAELAFEPDSRDTVKARGTTYRVESVQSRKLAYRCKLADQTRSRRR